MELFNVQLNGVWRSDATMVCLGVCVGVHAREVIMEQIEQQLLLL